MNYSLSKMFLITNYLCFCHILKQFRLKYSVYYLDLIFKIIVNNKKIINVLESFLKILKGRSRRF